ncbi:histidinol-phosphate transaminase [Streptomyces sp. SM12]|uniref:pyridoxal phosphate-dependent aminotransferase n=1 Tax=Streptomyces sp. SM12 TaxID=1071602 RepID=UPI000CD4DEBB|nr:histidinol-phosphate transaminase [Streptomyces sp. SM12]
MIDTTSGPLGQAPAGGSFFRSGPADEDGLRLHLNETAYGPPPGAAEAVAEEAALHLERYPDSEYRALRPALARHFGVAPEMVAFGNGVDELVLLTSLAMLRAPDAEVTATAGTFPGYAASAATAGARMRALPLAEHAVPVPEMAAALRAGTDLAFVCNPLNPTGALLSAGQVRELLDAAACAPGVLVFDEAYLDFAGAEHHHALAAVREGAPALVLRTFSKAWGLASVRAGCVIGPPELIGRIERAARALPFRVSRPAQRAVLAALARPDHLEHVRTGTAHARELLVSGLTALGLRCAPSAANFVMVDVPGDSAALTARLAAEHRVIVRDLGLLGLPGRLRITVGSPEQVERCVDALAAVLRRVRPTAGAVR